MGAEPDDADLPSGAATGDARAFEVFYRRWLAPVMSYHLRATGSRELALDLTAKTFAALVVLFRASIESGRPRRGGCFRSRDISCRTACGARGSRRVLGRCLAGSKSRSRTRTWNRVEELPVGQREALHQRVVEERSYAAIAADMRCSGMVVRQRVHRALRYLRRSLEDPV